MLNYFLLALTTCMQGAILVEENARLRWQEAVCKSLLFPFYLSCSIFICFFSLIDDIEVILIADSRCIW